VAVQGDSLFVADLSNHRIRKINLSPVLSSPGGIQLGVGSSGQTILGVGYGYTTATDSMAITNTGFRSLSVTSVSFEGFNASSNASSFAVTPTAFFLDPGDTAYVYVTFTPSSAGQNNVYLKFNHNGEQVNPYTLLRGTSGYQVTPSNDILGFSSSDGSSATISFISGDVTYAYFAYRPGVAQGNSAPTVPVAYFEINSDLLTSVNFEADLTFQYTQAMLDSAGVTDENTLILVRFDPDNDLWIQMTTHLHRHWTTGASTQKVSAAISGTWSTNSVWSLASVTPSGIAAGQNSEALPTTFSLSEPTPNPFNPSTTIAYEVPEQTHITLTVYNLLGQEVVRLVDQVQAAGRYEAVWNGTNLTGAGVASGIYLYRITSGSGYIETKRMTLLK